MRQLLMFFLTLLTLLTYKGVYGQDPTIFDHLYAYDGTPKLIIQTNSKTLIKQKLKEKYQEGILTFTGIDGELAELPMRIRVRGNMRKRQCKLPPLKVDFKKSDLKEIGLDTLDKLKLVLQCRNSSSGEEYLVKERLIYDLYAAIDTNHILTRLIDIEMWNGDKLDMEIRGLIVEDEEQYAKRNNAKIIERGNIRSGSLDRGHYLKMIFFQCMIANTDWAIPNKHNVEMVAIPGVKRILAIPYDFDYAGLVGTSYAVPHESLPIKDVTDRYFRGFQVTEQEALATAQFFLNQQDTFMQVIDECDYCSESIKREVKSFISPYFKILSNERKVKNMMVTTGR